MFMQFTGQTQATATVDASLTLYKQGVTSLTKDRAQTHIFPAPEERNLDSKTVFSTYLLKHYFFDSGLSKLGGLHDNTALRLW